MFSNAFKSSRRVGFEPSNGKADDMTVLVAILNFDETRKN